MNTGEQKIYRDNLVDRLCIWLFNRKMAKAVGKSPSLQGYDGLVELSNQIMQGRNAQEQQQMVDTLLHSIVPTQVLWLVRTLFSPTQLVCELNARFATLLFEWLVGPCEVIAADVKASNGQLRTQNSGVQIQKCRYLESSRCVGMCVNMCKLPTQNFFTQELGIPLTMTPDFEDFSCKMVFGQVPPPLETEAIYDQPCLTTHCEMANPKAKACPKMRNS